MMQILWHLEDRKHNLLSKTLAWITLLSHFDAGEDAKLIIVFSRSYLNQIYSSRDRQKPWVYQIIGLKNELSERLHTACVCACIFELAVVTAKTFFAVRISYIRNYDCRKKCHKLCSRLYSADGIYLYSHLSYIYSTCTMYIFHSVNDNNRQYIGKRRINFVNELCEARCVCV